MGKHKEKSKKHKKNKKQKREYTSSSEEEWVEKKIDSSSDEEKIVKRKKKRKTKHRPRSSSEENEVTMRDHDTSSSSNEEDERPKNNKYQSQSTSGAENSNGLCQMYSDEKNSKKRDDWMSLPTSFLTSSNSDRKREREEEKRLERERQQYNPRECTRELNPYWKNGGDGLPNFKKPEDSDDEYNRNYEKKSRYINRVSNWKKNKESERKKSLEADKKKCTEKVGNKVESNSTLIQEEENVLSEKELNVLAAKLVKAEIMGNTKLVNDLKKKLEYSRTSVNKNSTSTDFSKEEEILLTHTDSQGRSQPVKLLSEYGESSGYHKRKKNIETHEDGHRVRYFADDDKYSLRQMFENEKYNSVEDQNSEFLKMASNVRKNDDMDDLFSDNIRKKESDSKIDSRNRDRAINEQQKISKSLDNCDRCIQSDLILKHLMISMGETVYLALPPYEPLTDSHCFIIPIRHVPCSTLLDENEWSDILDMRRSLVNMFRSKNQDVIFFETVRSLHRFLHMCIECIPLPKEDGDMAPIYFKKAIDESETEWAQNKKLISLNGRDVRKAVPKGLPYFSVSFGMKEGFAHVIEDEQMFPANFAQEIIGGMLDLHHSKWRNPKKQNFNDQSKRVLRFSKEWKDFDCTLSS